MPPAQSTSGNGATEFEVEPVRTPYRGHRLTGPDADLPVARLNGPVVIGMVILTGLVVLLMVSLIYYRWVTITDPTTAIIVRGDDSYDGAVVKVTGNGARTVTATLDAANQYETPILVVPGTYTVTVEMGGRVLGKWEPIVERYRGSVLYLSERARRNATSQPAD
jgi:hypothetical protein